LVFAVVAEAVAEEVHRAALPGAAKHLRDRGLQPGVRVTDRELDADQATLDEAARERGPERLSLGLADIDREDLRRPVSWTPCAITSALLTTRPPATRDVRRARGGVRMALDQVTRRRLAQITAALTAEYDGVFSPTTVVRVVEASLRRLGSATVTWHLPLLTERFARRRLRVVARVDGCSPKPHPVVLFVCAHNAGRSHVAAALARHVSEDRIEALSAAFGAAGCGRCGRAV
jgi:hypothetical protein